MKKTLLIFFGIFFGFAQYGFAAPETVPVQIHRITTYEGHDNWSFAGTENCKVYTVSSSDNNDQYLHIGGCASTDAYQIIKNKQCQPGTKVCILGSACEASDIGSKQNHCWYSKWGSNDEWCQDNEDGCPSAPVEISECSDEKLKNTDSRKIPVFVDTAGKVIKTDVGYFPQSLVMDDGYNKFNMACFGYICPDGTYGCQDGTCTPGCPNDPPPPPPPRSTPGPYEINSWPDDKKPTVDTVTLKNNTCVSEEAMKKLQQQTNSGK